MGMLRSAYASSSAKQQQRVLLLLSVNNADKAPKPASFEQRLCMMECFGREFLGETAGSEVQVDIGVTTRPYFTDKAVVIAESDFYGGMHAEYVFLAGFDTMIRIFDGKYYKAGGGMRQALDPFFEKCRLRITTRPDNKWGSTEDQSAYLEKLRDPEGEFAAGGGNVDWIERVEMVTGEEGDGVSSSAARDKVKEEGGLREADKLVGREVREWIERERSYRQD
jgi:nicotinamide-nucleotide adenylyltransferase